MVEVRNAGTEQGLLHCAHLALACGEGDIGLLVTPSQPLLLPAGYQRVRWCRCPLTADTNPAALAPWWAEQLADFLEGSP